MHLEHRLLFALCSLHLFGTLQSTDWHDPAVEHLHEVTLATHATAVAHVPSASKRVSAKFESSNGIIVVITLICRTETFLVTTEGSFPHVVTC